MTKRFGEAHQPRSYTLEWIHGVGQIEGSTARVRAGKGKSRFLLCLIATVHK